LHRQRHAGRAGERCSLMTSKVAVALAAVPAT
jgi:hypothetical protein